MHPQESHLGPGNVEYGGGEKERERERETDLTSILAAAHLRSGYLVCQMLSSKWATWTGIKSAKDIGDSSVSVQEENSWAYPIKCVLPLGWPWGRTIRGAILES
jgi:hypothetical protein